MSRRVRHRKSARLSDAEVLRLKGEIVRLVRDCGMSVSGAERHMSLYAGWSSSRYVLDPEFKSAVSAARLAVVPSGDWQGQFISSRRRGQTRNEALDEVRSIHPEVTAAVVEGEIASNSGFASELDDLSIRSRWEVEDNVETRAKRTSTDARLYLGSGAVDPRRATPAARVERATREDPLPEGWVDPEVEAEQAEWLEGKPYGKKRLTSGALKRLSAPRPVGEVN